MIWGAFQTHYRIFLIPDVPFNLETLRIIFFPYALSLALVGLIESLLTAQIVDEMTDTHSNKKIRNAEDKELPIL
ncbi:hypothetical protein GCM10020331_037300 [Ectobacillus funiculus]